MVLFNDLHEKKDVDGINLIYQPVGPCCWEIRVDGAA